VDLLESDSLECYMLKGLLEWCGSVDLLLTGEIMGLHTKQRTCYSWESYGLAERLLNL